MQPGYTPELNIVGAAIGAPVPDLAEGVRSVNGKRLTAGLIPIGLAALSREYPGFADRMDRYLTPQGRAIIAETSNHCTTQNILSNLMFDLNGHLTVPFHQVSADPVVRQALLDAISKPSPPP